MKLNDIHQPEEVLEEGLLRVIGKVLKYAAIVIGTVLLIGITKRIFFPEEEKEKIEQQDEKIKYAYKVILGLRVDLTKASYIKRVKENFLELSQTIGEKTNVTKIMPEVYSKKHSRTEYSMNTILWYIDRQDVNEINKVVERINDRHDMDIQILQIKKQRL